MPGTLLDHKTHAPLQQFMSDQLAQVDRIFRDQLKSDLPSVNLLCHHIERYQGKMLRPMLTLLAGLAAHPDIQKTPRDEWERLLNNSHRVIAAVTEMIHMATLVHDDVLDEADMRRSGDTVNFLHGNEAAVLLGDYLISNAFHLCSTLGKPDLNERIGQTTNELCAGELLQVHHRNNFTIDEPTYFAVIERKTASLIGLCCELGAQQSGGSPTATKALTTFGRRMGIAFQIQDDLLDLVGDQEIVGKSLGQDLAKGKLTLPMILFFSNASATDRQAMFDLFGQENKSRNTNEIRRRVINSGAVQQAREVSLSLVNEATTTLQNLAPSPVRSLLADLAQAVVDRQF